MDTVNNLSMKEILQELFDDLADRIEIEIVPDKDEPYNLDKAMVYTIYDPGQYEGIFLKLNIK